MFRIRTFSRSPSWNEKRDITNCTSNNQALKLTFFPGINPIQIYSSVYFYSTARMIHDSFTIKNIQETEAESISLETCTKMRAKKLCKRYPTNRELLLTLIFCRIIYLYNKEKTYFLCLSVCLSVSHHFVLTGKSSGHKTRNSCNSIFST